MKTYNTGLIVGRFQMIHKGHTEMIRRALDVCETVVIFIGSAQESGTVKNPFNYLTREYAIRAIFTDEANSGRLKICRLPDIGVGNNDIWGRYVLGAYDAIFHSQPDLYITGCEKERTSWFTNDMAPNMDELRISRHTYNISASDCRYFLSIGAKDAWAERVPAEIHHKYDEYKKVIDDVMKKGDKHE